MDTDLVAELGAPGGPAGDAVLLVGDAVRHAARVREAGWRPVEAGDAPDFGVQPASCAAAIVENALARDPWDRWLLQRVHRALATGGTLAVREPNQLDLSTPAGVAYVASRGLRQALRVARRRLGGGAPPGPSFDGRRPSRAALAAMLSGLRYGVARTWDERGGPWGALLPARFAPRIGAVARALPSVAGLADAWPDEAAHRRAYEAAQPGLLATRAAWAAANPRWVGGAPAAFDPEAYRGRTVLVLAPHPDDEVIGAGGTLLALARAGARLVCVQATDGSAGAALERSPEAERKEARLREAVAVSDAIGFAALHLWRTDNRHFRAEPALADRLAALIAEERPALVLLPFVTEAHEDHLTLSVLLAMALRRTEPPADAQVLGYEVWSLVPANVVHDVTPRMPELESLLFHYDLAMRIDDFVHFCADRALYHGYAYAKRPCYLEAFHAVKAADFEALLRTVKADLP
jgi:LmbE family N-acetylglucosaminyl deacetylase